MLRNPYIHIGSPLAVIELAADLRAGAAEIVFQQPGRGVQVSDARSAREAQNRREREFFPARRRSHSWPVP